MSRTLRALGQFGIDLILGDDWAMTAIVAGGLLASGALVVIDRPAWWPLPLAVVFAARASLRRAVLRGG